MKKQCNVPLQQGVEDGDLSQRTFDCLQTEFETELKPLTDGRFGTFTASISVLTTYTATELLAIPGFGRASLREVRKFLARHSLQLEDGRASQGVKWFLALAA